MRRFPDTPHKRSRIEIIPMIDVMMFLLVFFVLISINVIPALGLKTKLPHSSQAHEQHLPVRVVVTLTRDGVIQFDGVTVPGMAQLRTMLLDRKDKAGPQLTVVIRGDEATPLQRLVDVMGVVKDAGVDAMSIATKGR